MDDTVLQMSLSGILRWGGYFWMIWMGMMSSWVSVKWVSGDGANMEGSVWRRNGQGEPVEGAQCCRHVQNHKMINVCCAQSLNVCNLVKQWDETDTTKCSNSEFAKRIHPQVGRNGRVCMCGIGDWINYQKTILWAHFRDHSWQKARMLSWSFNMDIHVEVAVWFFKGAGCLNNFLLNCSSPAVSSINWI